LRILLTGATGQVGWELRKTLAPLGEVRPLDRFGLNLADVPTLVASVRALQPGIIVNAAAYTAVDKAESERDEAFAVNATGPRVLAEEARRIGALPRALLDRLRLRRREGIALRRRTTRPIR
jgi:dTDP-4-dehydrorhamnose reductase